MTRCTNVLGDSTMSIQVLDIQVDSVITEGKCLSRIITHFIKTTMLLRGYCKSGLYS
jgi:hypothetical protein